jgi:hypothetical protein
MEKTAKITRTVFVSEWTNPQGGQVYYHTIELDNGDSGQIGSKEKMPVKLNPGTELTYTIEATSRGNKIKAVTPNQGSSFRGRQSVDPKTQMISFAMAYTKDLVVAGKVPLETMSSYFDKIYTAMISKL